MDNNLEMCFIIRARLRVIADILNGEEEIDWMNEKQKKFFISLFNGKVNQSYTYLNKHGGDIYCLSENFMKEAFEDIGEFELEWYLKQDL